MADEALQAALGGFNVTPAETYWGVGAGALGKSLPLLIDPVYGDRGTNIGIALGGALLQGLLGYQARKEAAQQTLEINTLGNTMQELSTPQARTEFIKNVSDPLYQTKLSTLATALNAQNLDTQNAIKRAAGLETGKMKALQEFYASPEGAAQREFELNKIREEAAARRTPMDEWLEKQRFEQEQKKELLDIGQQNRLQLKGLGFEQTKELRTMQQGFERGEREATQAWKDKTKKTDQEYEAAILKYKAELGVEAAKQKAQELATLEMDLINKNIDPEIARLQVKAALTEDMQQNLVKIKEESDIRKIEKAREEREKESAFKKQLDMEMPTVPAALRTQSAKRVTVADTALEIASDIEKYNNYVTYRIGTKFSATDEALLRSRIAKLTMEERLALTGTASNEGERAAIDQMLNGDFTSGPETKAALLKRFAYDEKKSAISNMKGGAQSTSAFVKSVEDSLQNNSTVTFALPSQQSQTSGTAEAAQMFVNSLKNKYGAEWKTKMTQAEKTAAAALLQARGQ
jgi:hypothetical protein